MQYRNVLILLFISITSFSQSISEDTTWNPGTPEIPPPRSGTTGTADTRTMTLDNFLVGYYSHKNALWFCKSIVNKIESIEHKNDKIIRILITGWADGGKNGGMLEGDNILECNNIFTYSVAFDKKLAQLRACMIETMLKSLLSKKDYFFSVRLNQSSHDIPDDTKRIDGKFRKVDVVISYIDKK